MTRWPLAGVLLAGAALAEPLSFAQALAWARARSTDAAEAAARLTQSEGRRRQALAALLPSVDVSTGLTVNSAQGVLSVVDEAAGYRARPSTDPDAPEGTLDVVPNRVVTLRLQPSVVWSVGAQASVPLLNLPAAWRLQGAGLRVEAQQQLAGRAGAVAQVRAWQQLLALAAAQRLTALAREREQVAGTQAQAAQARLDAGQVDRLVVTRARVAAAAAARAVRQLEASEVSSRAQLEALLGMAVGEAPAPPAPPPVEDLAAPAQARPDVDAARRLEAAAGRELTASRLRLVPRLDLLGQTSVGNIQNFAGVSQFWVLQGRMSWSLFDGGDRYGERRANEGLAAEAAARRELQERSAQREVSTAQAQVRASQASLSTSQQELALARESLEAATAQFQAGQLGYLELLDAQGARFTAEEANVSEGLRLATARLDLALALGIEQAVLDQALSPP